MFREWFNEASISQIPLISLLIFFGIFVLVLGYVFFALRDRDEVDRMSTLPLDDDASADNRDGGTRE